MAFEDYRPGYEDVLLPVAATKLAIAGLDIGKKSNVPSIDVSGELARIQALYSQARERARQSIRFESGRARGQAASNLAARGVYSSPVSENVFGEIRERESRSIAESEGRLASEEAGTMAQVLSSLIGAENSRRLQQQQIQAQRQGALFGSLGALGTSLLLAKLGAPAAVAAAGSGAATPGAGYSPMLPQTAAQPYAAAFPTGPTPYSQGESMDAVRRLQAILSGTRL